MEAVSYRGGKEISRDLLQTSRKPAGIRLHPEKTELAADGHDLLYIGIDIVDPEGVVVTDASVTLRAGVSGCAELAGFGTGNPVTDENYTEGETVSRSAISSIVRALSSFASWNASVPVIFFRSAMWSFP